jgi:hypothetical protein
MENKCVNIILAEDDPLNQKVALLMLKKLVHPGQNKSTFKLQVLCLDMSICMA